MSPMLCAVFTMVGSLVMCATSVASQESIGDFVYSFNVDAMTDLDESYIVTTEEHGTLLGSAKLYWRCNSTTATDLFVSVNDYVGSDGRADVQWRFDRDPPSATRKWNISTNGTAVFAPAADLVRFTGDALPAGQVTVRITDFRGVNYDLVFSLTGLTAALDRLSCAPAVEATSRRLAREARRAAADKTAREAELHPFPDDILYIGNPDNKRYVSVDKSCWPIVVSASTAVHFRTEAEARGQGYRPSNRCRQ